MGAAAGASGTVWAQRRVRGAIEEFGADQVIAVAGKGARAVARTIVAAVGEGRDGMAQREQELRNRLHGPESTLDRRRLRPGTTLRPVPTRRTGR